MEKDKIIVKGAATVAAVVVDKYDAVAVGSVSVSTAAADADTAAA